MLLEAQGLVKRYGSATGYEAVRDLSLNIEGGEWVSIIGRSGSGKSTLLAMLGALSRPTQGRVLLADTDFWALAEPELAAFRSRHLGFIFQFPSLLSNLSALDNVMMPVLLGGGVDTKVAGARARSLLERVGLAERLTSFPGELSGGEQRRVVIARALINAPRLLLADEPTSDLDEDTEADIMDLLDWLRHTEAFSLILVTHNLELAQRADRRYQMQQGRLSAIDTPAVERGEATPRTRHFGPPVIGIESPAAPAAGAVESLRLGRDLWANVRGPLWIGAALFAGALLINEGVERYQAMKTLEHQQEIAALEQLALAGLRADIHSITDLGEGRYELTLYQWNVTGEQSIYVMSPQVRAYVQVGTLWQEVPLQPADAIDGAVLKITGKQLYRYIFEARPKEYAELFPYYMHLRFANTMLISPRSEPGDALFERADNYYAYVKPWNVDDQLILQKMKFPGKPPVWIPMPPH